MPYKPRLVLKIDTRETLSLRDEFREGVFDSIVDECLPFGDYWCEIDGSEVPIVFERKGFSDCFGTLTNKERIERLKERCAEAKSVDCEFILAIEGSMREVANGYQHSSVDGNRVIKTIFSFWVKHGLIPMFFEDRRSMARFIEETYTSLARNYKK